MKHLEEILASWRARTVSGETQQLSEQARQRIAAQYLEVAASSADQTGKLANSYDLNEVSAEITECGVDEGLTATVLRAELQTCQLSVLEILASDEANGKHPAGIQDMVMMLRHMDVLTTQSVRKFVEVIGTSSDSPVSPDTNGKQGKTLQHEIRTPLQGALLTTELMLEDAGHGDLVSADDILAVRKSIETAVGILNDFASRSRPD